MASLYIDRLKNDFQRIEPTVLHTKPYKLRCPQIMMEILNNEKSDHSSLVPQEFGVRSAVMKLLPSVPKIFTIGLRLDRDDNDDASAYRYWDISGVKKFFSHYFGLIRSMSWKSVPKDTPLRCYFSLISVNMFVSKCTKNLEEGRFEEENVSTLRYKNEGSRVNLLHDFHFSRKSISISRSSHNGIADDSRPDRIGEKASRSCDCKNCRKTDGRSRKSKTSQTVQSRRRKSRRDEEKVAKENVSCDSKDIETIFTANRDNFNAETSSTNLQLFQGQYAREMSPRKRKSKKRSSKTTKEKGTSISKENVSCVDGVAANRERRSLKSKKKAAVLENSTSNIFKFSDAKNYDRSRDSGPFALLKHENSDVRRILGARIENGQSRLRNEGEIVVESSVLIDSRRNSTDSRNGCWMSINYVLENKTSELMILGNVKKRLEKDYDDYVSLNDIDLDEPFDHANELDNIIRVKQAPSEMNINDYRSSSTLKKARSTLSTSASTPSDPTRSSSVLISNSESCRPRSSYHTSFMEPECSSSIEYCTASNLSLKNFQSTTVLVESCPMPVGVSNDGKVPDAGKQRCSSKETSFEEDELFQDTNDFFEEDLKNSCSAYCCRRSSTPKFVTESMDSGILTDYSRDRCRNISNEGLQGEIGDKAREKCCYGEMDLPPTYDFNTDSSYSDESLNRRVDVAVKKFTENLILSERRARSKLRRMENPVRRKQERRRRRKKCRQVKNMSDCFSRGSSTCIFECSPRFHDDDWPMSSTTPPLFSFSDSEIDHL